MDGLGTSKGCPIEFDHESEEHALNWPSEFREMREITRNYQLPVDACPSFTGLYFGLRYLEKDLHRHVHLENNVLFDQAVALENRVFGEMPSDFGGCCHSGH